MLCKFSLKVTAEHALLFLFLLTDCISRACQLMIHVGSRIVLILFMQLLMLLCKKLLFCCCCKVILVLSSSGANEWVIGSEDRSWILCCAAVRCHINGRKKSFARADFAGPPMLFRSIRHSDHIASSEVQLAALLRSEII